MSAVGPAPTVIGMSSRPVLAGGLAAAALLVAAGCGLVWNTLSDGLVQDTPIAEVRINGGSGDVTVLGDATKGVDVRRTVRYVGDTRPGQTMSVVDGILTVNTSCGNRCRAAYEIHVARGVKVTGKNNSGNVSLSDVSDVDVQVDSGDLTVRRASGSVSLSADSGRVQATDVTGGATLSADSGDVTLTGIGGPVRVTVGSGRIEATGLSGDSASLESDSGDIEISLRAPANVTVRADSGRIEVAAPDGCCRVQASASSGTKDIRIATSTTSAYLLDLRTGSGDITVRPS
jgi:hypothetical protein